MMQCSQKTTNSSNANQFRSYGQPCNWKAHAVNYAESQSSKHFEHKNGRFSQEKHAKEQHRKRPQWFRIDWTQHANDTSRKMLHRADLLACSSARPTDALTVHAFQQSVATIGPTAEKLYNRKPMFENLSAKRPQKLTWKQQSALSCNWQVMCFIM